LQLATLYNKADHDIPKALQFYAKAVEAHPVDAHEGSAHCFYQLQQPELALEQIEAASTKSNGALSPDGLLTRANIYFMVGRMDESISDYQLVISSSHSNLYADAYIGRGMAHYAKNNKEDAKADFEAAIKLNEDSRIVVEELLKRVENK